MSVSPVVAAISSEAAMTAKTAMSPETAVDEISMSKVAIAEAAGDHFGDHSAGSPLIWINSPGGANFPVHSRATFCYDAASHNR